MSNYGNPPSDPYGQNPQNPPNPYGQPQQNPSNPYGQPPQDPAMGGGYGQNPYGAQAYGQGDYGQGGLAPQGFVFAHWGKRVAGSLIDGVLTMLAALPALIGGGMVGASATTTYNSATQTYESTPGPGSGLGFALIGLGVLTAFGFFIWNTFIKQGSTGYTIGKGVMGIKLVKLETGQPIGAGMAFVRYLVGQAISGVTCGVGGLIDHLWPLWDDKNQTLHDKAVGSVVIEQPKG